MRLHAILCVRDEGDIIAQTLGHLLSWADTLSVFDTGSTDGTWETVLDAAGREPRIEALGSEPVLFHGGVRAWVFDQVRERFRKGDWIARVDADEFYHVDPRDFIFERIHPHEHVVCAQLHDFIILKREMRAWREGREGPADRVRPIEDRRRHYIINRYPEIRLFRYRPSLRWPATAERPLNPGPVARARIPIRHYRWRDPAQAAARLALRKAQAPSMPIGGAHWARWELSEFVRRARAKGVYRYDPEVGLPEVEDGSRSHLELVPKRAMLSLLSRAGLLPLVDRLRPGIDPEWAPTPLARADVESGANPREASANTRDRGAERSPGVVVIAREASRETAP